MNINDLLTVENLQRNLMLYRTIEEIKLELLKTQEELNLESRKLTTKPSKSDQSRNRAQ
jgi:hypothetical protein